MQWFKHQTTAHSDAKLEKVLIRYGADGYALYWYCLELIAGKVCATNITFELEHDAELLGHKLKIDSLRVEEIMKYMISLELFELSGKTVTCLKLAKSLDERWTRSADLKAVIRQSEDGLKTVYKPLPLDKNRRDKKRKDIGRFTPPTLAEVDEYCKSRGNSVDPQRFLDHYEANGWMRGKTKIKDWRACVRTWEKTNPADDIPETLRNWV